MSTFTSLGYPSQPPLLQHAFNEWRVWTAYNRERTAGTYLILHPTGKIERITVQPTGVCESHIIKP